MRLVVASGKGGTGKTTVTAALSRVWPEPAVAVDLDVEEPNLHLFLKPEFTGQAQAVLEVPQADEEVCTSCGLCAEICQFKAINIMAGTLLVFPEMCHGCGGCLAVCPAGALSPAGRELGQVSWGRDGANGFVMGRLRVGEAMSPPLMRQVLERLPQVADGRGDAVIDAPPGVSCPAVTAALAADAILLVTEPTPFGAHDLALAAQAFAPLGKPMAVVVNRAGLGDDSVYEICRAHGLPVVCEIPFARASAEAYAQGRVLSEASPELRRQFEDLARQARGAVRHGWKEAAHA